MVNIDHVDRVSDDLAKLADKLSRREQSVDEEVRLALEKAERGLVSGAFLHWLENPRRKIDLVKMIEELKKKSTYSLFCSKNVSITRP